MKRIEAIIKPSKLDDVKQRLEAIGAQGITVTEVKGYGRQHGHTELYRGSEYVVEFVPKVLLTILVNDDQVEGMVQAIILTARTGEIGDGKILVSPVEEVVRIRTNDKGAAAL